MLFTITGKIHPYAHRTFRGKYSARAQAYHASQNAIRWQLRNQMQLAGLDRITRGIPLRLRIHVTVPGGLHKFDATNVQKAVEDAAQSVVFDNDCWVDDVHTTRCLGDEYVTTLAVRALGEAV